jgi:hypothetical protein
MASLSCRKEVEAELLLLCKTRFMGLRALLKYVSGGLFSIAQGFRVDPYRGASRGKMMTDGATGTASK